MDSKELSQNVLNQLNCASHQFFAPEIDEKVRRNSGRMMQEIVRQRMQAGGVEFLQTKNTSYQWGEGIVLNRNSRVNEYFWTNYHPSKIKELMHLASAKPTIFLFCYFDCSGGILDSWALPSDLAFRLFSTNEPLQSGAKMIIIDRETNRLRNAIDSPSLVPYYRRIELTSGEIDSLAASIKQDAAAKEIAAESVDEDEEPGIELLYSQATVDYMLALCEHMTDKDWHKKNQQVYQQVLRDPTNHLVDELRVRYIQQLDPGVANSSRNVSVLKRNDFGRGKYYDYYWAAFYDPAQKSKTKSCQLFFGLLGQSREFNYGFAFGKDCEPYVNRLNKAINESRQAVADYLKKSNNELIIGNGKLRNEALENALKFPSDQAVNIDQKFELRVRFPIEQLPDRSSQLADEIGRFFHWVWPFFEASRTGIWAFEDDDEDDGDDDTDPVVDPISLQELSDVSALPLKKLLEIENALLAKQQVVLTGPPGTSKTYIAQLFAKYFTGEHNNQPQGSHSTIYMHANWGYEDFFEGIKPFTDNGVLKFEPKQGCFLEWVDSLQKYPVNSRHVMVLDEVNRCDTAAVLGELLQLMEYRGRSVRLLSGRKFRFPNNVFIIGTMNSADRSIGRMDLALRRRFLWVNLYPDYEVLGNWLSRAGNNPVKFQADDLRGCNQLLEDRGIPCEQHVGHALFMLQTFGNENQPSVDKPLVAEALKRIVHFSVIPYVRELCVMQFGRVDSDLAEEIETVLLNCLNEPRIQPSGPSDNTN